MRLSGGCPYARRFFALGLRHGLDADHPAAVDALTRFNAGPRSRLASCCGALFSVGHGTVVGVIAVAVGDTAKRYPLPGWAQHAGAWISIGSLTGLGALNLLCVFRTPPDQMARPAGLRARFMSQVLNAGHPLAIAGVGALFALSLDTISQAALFSTSAARFGAWTCAAILGGLFTLGMLLVDGMNDAWLAALLSRADQRARVISRATGLLAAVLSFAVAGHEAVCLLDPAWLAHRPSTPLAGALLIGIVAAGSYLLTLSITSTRCTEPPRPEADQVAGRA